MTQLDYTWEKRVEMIRAEEREDGIKLGIEQEYEQASSYELP